MCKATVQCKGNEVDDRDGGRSVRNRKGLEPDIRYREGGVVESVRRKGYKAPDGLFVEKPHKKYRCRCGREVCEAFVAQHCMSLLEG